MKRNGEDNTPRLHTVLPTLGEIEASVLATGELEPSRLVSVGDQATGRIERVYVALGDTVGEEDPIAEIDSLTQQNALRNAEASLTNVLAQKRLQEATLKQAQQSYDREKRLYDRGAGAAQELEAAEATLEVAKAQIEALDAQIAQSATAVDSATVNLGFTKIISPMDGVVVAVLVVRVRTSTPHNQPQRPSRSPTSTR